MNLSEAEKLTLELINKYTPDYSFFWNNRKTQLGLCNYKNKTIYLSRIYVKHNSEELVRDTILHEIAHALSPKSGHGNKWKVKCIEIGCRPVRCKNDVIIPHKYTYKCGNCGRETGAHRLKKRKIACGSCCNKFNGGKFSEDFLVKLV